MRGRMSSSVEDRAKEGVLAKVSILEQKKIQAQVLVQLVKAFQEDCGEESANAVAYKGPRVKAGL